MDFRKMYMDAVDVDASYRFAKKMETFRTNPVLGFRTAGSEAECQTGEMIREAMEQIGLSDIHKDEIPVDAWEFKKAVMEYTDRRGEKHVFQLGGYQTDFFTDGFKEFSLVYVGRGREKDYRKQDVKGKLVLADINQRDEWWINFPVYQAWLKGAAAFIAVQDNGYGEVDDHSLNTQDIAGPAYAPAFSMSKADAAVLKADLEEAGEITVRFDAESRVKAGQVSYNIWGTIPGEEEDNKILLSAHYDSYYSGFQDDNCAVAMMLGIGAALIKIGYKPKKTLVFCAMAAEEWGITDSKYDWSTGAWQQVFCVRPQWQKEVMANLNFELPAHAHGRKGAVRGTYEYSSFLKDFLDGLPEELDVEKIYPAGIEVRKPIETWSDDFSIAISGIPSIVNEFSAGSFMETHYHSQFDNDDYYDRDVFQFNHCLYGLLLIALDQARVAPVDLERVFRAARRTIEPVTGKEDKAAADRLVKRLLEGEELGKDLYKQVEKINRRSASSSPEQRKEERELQRRLLDLFRREQDHFVRLDWQDGVLFPHEAVQNNLTYLEEAIRCLEEGDGKEALRAIYKIDNNSYAFQFEKEVFSHFTEYVLSQDRKRLQWGAGRIVHHENLFDVVSSLKKKIKAENGDFSQEKKILEEVEENQLMCYDDDICYMTVAVEEMIEEMTMLQGLIREVR